MSAPAVALLGLLLLQGGSLGTEHVRALRLERSAALLEAWTRAEPDARAAAHASLRAAHPRGAPAGAPPTLQAVDAARRVLEDPAAKPARRDLCLLVDALDVRAVPGAFPPASEGLGQALTVRVSTLWDVSAPGDVDVELVWIAPDGARTSARREPIGARAFTSRGFEMYVRAPLSEPGVWHLVLEATRGAETVAAAPVPVACVAAPAAPEVDDPVAALLAEDFAALLEAGSRTALPPGVARPLGVAYEDPRGTEWAWSVRADEAPRCAIVLLAPPEEAAEAILAEPLGSLWREVGAELGARVLSARLPYPLGSNGRPDLARFLRELPGLRGLADDVPIHLVARGMSTVHLVPGLAGASAGAPASLAGVVLTAVAPKRREGSAPVGFRTLIVGGPEPDAAATTPGAEHVAADGPPLLTDLELPRLVGEWIATFTAVGAREPAGSEGAGGR